MPCASGSSADVLGHSCCPSLIQVKSRSIPPPNMNAGTTRGIPMNTFIQELAGITTGDSGVVLPAALTVPMRARGVVLLAHGSGGNLNSPQNLDVAAVLQNARFGTLRLELLDEHEGR